MSLGDLDCEALPMQFVTQRAYGIFQILGTTESESRVSRRTCGLTEATGADVRLATVSALAGGITLDAGRNRESAGSSITDWIWAIQRVKEEHGEEFGEYIAGRGFSYYLQ